MRPTLSLAPVLAVFLLAPAPVAAKPASADWMGKAASFSNADVINGRGASLGPVVAGKVPETLQAVDVIVTLVDKQGLTQVEIVCNTSGIYELQNGSEFGRRSALGSLHTSVFSALTAGSAEGGGGGAFGRVQLAPSAGEKSYAEFMKGREPEDVVVTLGWAMKEGPQVYGTLYSDRIELNMEAPKAAKK
jgi:hypothetical protein